MPQQSLDLGISEVPLKDSCSCEVSQSDEIGDLIVENSSDKKTTLKETWSRHLEFILSCIGYAVGFGAFWRFPYICMKNGGGAFLIPYFISLILCGMPLFFMELVLGQFSGLGPTAVWNICPLFKGVGWSMLMMSGLATVYAAMIIAWVLYFLSNSFSSPLPWADCGHEWNKPTCFNRNANVTWQTTLLGAANATTAAEEFWTYNVLDLSPGIDKLGGIRWPLFYCLLITWVIVFLCLFKGIKWSGKVVYVTATLPYIILTIILIRGAMLPGALQGITFYLKPDFEVLKSPKVWAEACLQIFYSLGPTWGGLIAMSRYNKFNNNCLRDSVVICCVCCGTSFYSGFICFSILGYMAQKISLPIQKVIVAGPGLVFSVYPEAIAQLPISPFWAISFFLMLLTLGIDSLFGMIETITSGFVDEFPDIFKFRKSRLIAGLCLLIFLMGIPLTTRGGMYVFQIFDTFVASYAAIVIALIECLVVGHLYGPSRMYRDIEMMIGHKPSCWWRICWCYITPVIMLLLLSYNFINTSPPKYDQYTYPQWSLVISMSIALCSIIPIPLYAAFRIATEKGTLYTRIKVLIKSSEEGLPNKTTTDVELMEKF